MTYPTTRTASLRTLLALALVFGATQTAALAGWGNLKGKFVYDGTAPSPQKLDASKDPEVCGKHELVDESLLVSADGGIANCVLWVRTKGVEVADSYKKTETNTEVFDNKGCRFEPHILPVWISQTLEIHNSDAISHNSNMAPLGGEAINPLLAANSDVKYHFAKAPLLPVQVTCNIHPWMKGYIVARDNPYVAVSKADGTFDLKDLPTGELEFQAWQEKAGYLATSDWTKGRFKLTIKEGDNDLGTIKLSPALFAK